MPDQLSPDTALSTLLTRLLLASAASADVAYVTVPDTESANVITEHQCAVVSVVMRRYMQLPVLS